MDITNEKLAKKYANPFELVNYAIKQCEGMIRTGRSPLVRIDIQNPAVQALAEIVQGKDVYADFEFEEEFDDFELSQPAPMIIDDEEDDEDDEDEEDEMPVSKKSKRQSSDE